jgi:hypothetical protein
MARIIRAHSNGSLWAETPLRDQADGLSSSATGTTWTTVSDASVVAPFSGDYLVRVSATVLPDTAGPSAEIRAIAGSVTFDGGFVIPNDSGAWTYLSRTGVLANVVGGTTVNFQVRSGSAGVTISTFDREMALTPIRVG